MAGLTTGTIEAIDIVAQTIRIGSVSGTSSATPRPS